MGHCVREAAPLCTRSSLVPTMQIWQPTSASSVTEARAEKEHTAEKRVSAEQGARRHSREHHTHKTQAHILCARAAHAHTHARTFPNPLLLEALEGGAVGQVEADDRRARAAAVEARQRVEALLAGRIPDAEIARSAAVELDLLHGKGGADRGYGLAKGVIEVPVNEAGLADARLACEEGREKC